MSDGLMAGLLFAFLLIGLLNTWQLISIEQDIKRIRILLSIMAAGKDNNGKNNLR